MDIIEIIKNKRDGKVLSSDEITFAVNSYVDGSVADYQMSSLLMAIVMNGMTDEETLALTKVMSESGDIISFGKANGNIFDKHSTGGVSDSTTLIVMAILCELGIKVVKMSGRGLGHTGGTLDKLDVFAGLKTQFSKSEISKLLAKTNGCIMGASDNLAPADKMIYALRDVTGTVESIPLIASSIVSKKLASGADDFVLDVKCGSAAFMPTKKDAKKLARTMLMLLNSSGKRAKAIITAMDEPLGSGIGCEYEIADVLHVLDGETNALYEVSREICVLALIDHMNIDSKKARQMIDECVVSGRAKSRLQKILSEQGMIGTLDDYITPHKIKYVTDIVAEKNGKISSINALSLAQVVNKLGGGRTRLEDIIKLNIGIELFVRTGDEVLAGEVMAKVHYDSLAEYDKLNTCINNAFIIKKVARKTRSIIKVMK